MLIKCRTEVSADTQAGAALFSGVWKGGSVFAGSVDGEWVLLGFTVDLLSKQVELR